VVGCIVVVCFDEFGYIVMIGICLLVDIVEG